MGAGVGRAPEAIQLPPRNEKGDGSILGIRPGKEFQRGHLAREGLRTLFGGILRKNPDVVADIAAGRQLKDALNGLTKEGKTYEDPKTQNKAEVRARLVENAKKLVDISMQPGVALTPDEQQYIDSITIAAANDLRDKIPHGPKGGQLEFGLIGTNSQRTELLRQQGPHMLVRRTPEGLAITVATGEISFTPDGAIQMQGTTPLGELADNDRDTRFSTQVAEYTLNRNRLTTAGHAEDRLSYMDASGAMQSIPLHADNPEYMATTQRIISGIERDQTSRNQYYQHEGVIRYHGEDLRLRVVSSRNEVTNGLEMVAEYVANGGALSRVPLLEDDGVTQRVDKDGYPMFMDSAVLLDSPNAASVWPNNRDGVRFDGITTKLQAMIDSERVMNRANTLIGGERGLGSLQRLLEHHGAVPVADIDTTLTDPVVGMAFLGNGDVTGARDQVSLMQREVRQRLSTLPPHERLEEAFTLVLNRVDAYAGGRHDSPNDQKAIWRTAELIAKAIDPDYNPSTRALIDRARGLRVPAGSTSAETVSDARTLLAKTNLSREVQDILLADIQEHAGTGNPNRSLREVLSQAIDARTLDRANLSPEMRAILDEAEVTPRGVAEALRTIEGITQRPTEEPADLRARIETQVRALNVPEHMVEAMVDAEMQHRGLSQADIREAAEEALQEAAQTGRLNLEAVRALREAGRFSEEETEAFGSALESLTGVQPLPNENPATYAERVAARMEELDTPEELRPFVQEMVMRINGMDEAAVNARAAQTFLDSNGVESVEDLNPDQRVQYLVLSGAPTEQVLEAVRELAGLNGEVGNTLDAITTETQAAAALAAIIQRYPDIADLLLGRRRNPR